jgi:hypothetical protein
METSNKSSRVPGSAGKPAKYFSIFSLALSATLISISCKTGKNSDSSGSNSLAAVDQEVRDYLRSAVLEPSGDVVDLSSLFNDGSTSADTLTDGFNASQSEYSSIVAMSGMQGNFNSPNAKAMRLESLNIHKSIPKTVVRLASRNLGMQLSLSAKTKIKVFRIFQTDTDALKTPPVQLTDLPVDLENAERMRSGDLFVIPVDGRLMTSVDGSFLRHSFAMGRVLDSMLGSSLIGQAQTGLRANLQVEGRFEIHIFKTEGDRVRVRVFQQNERSMSSEVGATAMLAAKVTVVPFSRLQQISEIKKTLALPSIAAKQLRLPDVLRRFSRESVLKETAADSQSESLKFNEEMKRKPDGLLELSSSIQISPEAIQNQTIARVDALLERIPGQVNVEIRKIGDKIKVYSDQEVRFDAGVSWVESRKDKQQFYGDYVFDLKNDTAREAFLQAVSGGAVLLSSRPDLSGRSLLSKSLHNFILAERISRSTAGESNAPVVRMLSGSSKTEVAESRFQIKFGPKVSYALSESWLRENFRLQSVNENSIRDGFLSRWSFRQSTFFGLVSEHRERSSGFMSDVSFVPGAQTLYWYAQELDSKTHGQSHLEQFLLMGQNILGPVASSLGLERLYSGEVDGRFRGRIVVGLPSTTLDKIFDPSLASESLVWRAAGRVAASFDNTFGLPFLVIPSGMPSSVLGTTNEEDCRVIASHWGSFYCHYLAQEFLPRLRDAQLSRTTEAKARFLETFFSKGFGANKIGSDVLARVLIQMGVELGGKLSGSDLLVVLEGRHEGSSAAEYNPQITYGNSELLRVLEQTLPAW